MSRVVIVGSSIGGVRAAQALRREGFAGDVILVGEESSLPYDKPPLSKQFLAGDWDVSRLALLDDQMAARDGIELRLGDPATGLDVADKRVIFGDGEELSYESLIIATGASARPAPWRAQSGLHVLRTLKDAQRLREEFAGHQQIVMVGGGFIGAEVAATAHALGHHVTIVDPLPAPIGRVVGAEIGELFTGLHHRHGVTTRFGVGVEAVDGEQGDLRLRLTDGSELTATTVIAGIGTVPNDAWLVDSGLTIENGVLCDEYSRAVGAPDVYAVGDVARWRHPRHREYVRVEHWTNAVDQAACAAHNIVHPDDIRAYGPVEYVWSDQYDWKVQIVGRPAQAVRSEMVGTLSSAQARAAVLYADETECVCGAATINWPRALVQCRRAVGEGATYSDALEQIRSLSSAQSKPSDKPLASTSDH